MKRIEPDLYYAGPSLERNEVIKGLDLVEWWLDAALWHVEYP